MRLQLHVYLAIPILLLAAVLLVQTFLVDGWLLPLRTVSGSMAPGIRGPHVAVVCPKCATPFDVDALDLPASGYAICPQCDYRRVAIEKGRSERGDRLLVDRAAFELRDPRRWERVILREPGREREWAVKRIVGLPGERIGLAGGVITVNGQPVTDQPPGLHYLSPRGLDEAWQRDEPLGPAEYFVLGDNSTISRDSRHWPTPVTRDSLIGRVIAVW